MLYAGAERLDAPQRRARVVAEFQVAQHRGLPAEERCRQGTLCIAFRTGRRQRAFNAAQWNRLVHCVGYMLLWAPGLAGTLKLKSSPLFLCFGLLSGLLRLLSLAVLHLLGQLVALLELEMLAEVDLANHRVGGQFLGRTRLEDLALVEQVGAVGDGQRLVDVVVGDDDADVLVLERRHDRLDVLHGDGVDAREGLVEQDERRVDGHRARDLRTAPFAARKLDAEALANLLQAELLDQRLDALGLVLLREIGHFEYGADVVLDRQAAEDRCLLCQVAHAHLGAFVDRLLGQFGDLAFVVLEEDAPLRWA